ncbi:RRNA methyltransferase AviRa [Murinocardiopsis flavida]|uniref:rRNA methyltransferase AviRa n=1 Tax=Murinocardiopsis flavida TaxID=645275 RepID=A0A2P8CUW3_9ACTN|nr:rRNA methyltransferase [Murinocardiopsis flavida]PSK88761.1 RRNA methyltransferase AviRa [Murinocardiopsis flavida]
MSYRHAIERIDHSDLASGQVLHSAPGHPGFPVRLASELFQRAAALLPGTGPAALWDPCCGSGYLAAVVGLLHRDRVAHVLATDVDPGAAALAGRNLALLTGAGLAAREAELRARAAEFGKPSYAATADSAARLAGRLAAAGGDLAHEARTGDVFAPVAPAVPVDVVLTDVPYGALTHWAGAVPAGDPVAVLLTGVAGVLPGHAVLAVAARARRVAVPDGVPALGRVRVGNRAAVLVRAADLH